MKQAIQETVIVAYGRSAIGKAFKGSLKSVHPVDLGGMILAGVLHKLPALNWADIDDIVVGCARPEAQQGMNIGRMAALRAGVPNSVSAQAINRFCSSGLQAVASAANAIMAGQAQIMVAGGIESMSWFPAPLDPAHGSPWMLSHCPSAFMDMGVTAENVAQRYGVSRLEQDEFGLLSQRRAAAAQAAGILAEDIIPITVPGPDGQETSFSIDEGVRPNTTLEALSGLRTVFKENGTVTAGTSSQISDAAAFVVLMSRERADKLGLQPLARFAAYATGGVDPAYMGMGPVAAAPKALALAGLTMGDMDVIELNEAFAAQAIPCIQALDMDPERVNPNGGAIALGHPTGATGAILLGKAVTQLRRTKGRFGLITMCIGGGMGAAAIVERMA